MQAVYCTELSPRKSGTFTMVKHELLSQRKIKLRQIVKRIRAAR